MLIPITYVCPVCGESIESAADPSQGSSQQYVEDCQVCCRPLVLSLRIRGQSVEVGVEPESD